MNEKVPGVDLWLFLVTRGRIHRVDKEVYSWDYSLNGSHPVLTLGFVDHLLAEVMACGTQYWLLDRYLPDA